MTVLPIHPFPARMAPEVALAQCGRLSADAVVLDPMAGSGTVLRTAAEHGLTAIGFDLDPLAVLMTKVWTTPIDAKDILVSAHAVVSEAERNSPEEVRLPWIDDDPETRDFVEFWFGTEQQEALRRLAAALYSQNGPIPNALRIALSRLIITKDRGASLARDVSHSRPHRAYDSNDFPVMREFLRSAERLARRLGSQPPPGNVDVAIGDARDLLKVLDNSVDAVITSPPYLNAIDYIRGHRLSLVWLGYRVGDLRTVRAVSIGAERAPDPGPDRGVLEAVLPEIGNIEELPTSVNRMVQRYVIDLECLFREIRRVLKPGGCATIIVGNSCLRNVYLDNAAAAIGAASRSGLVLSEQKARDLPPSRRYLPPPAHEATSNLTKRMRTEVVLTFAG